MSLLVLSTHPIQYQAPIYRTLQQQMGLRVDVVYASDFSVIGYRDPEFGEHFAWDTDLLSGYQSRFLSRVEFGGAKSPSEVSARGIDSAIREFSGSRAILLLGYRAKFDLRAFIAARFTGLPLMFRAEVNDTSRTRSLPKQLVRDKSLSAFYSQFRRLLYIGQHAKSHYQRLGISNMKLVFSPYGVDTTPFQLDERSRTLLREQTRRQLAIEENTFLFIVVGKLSSRKAPDLPIEAMSSSPKDFKKAAILYVGDGELRHELERKSSKLGVNTQFVGFQNQHHLSRYYHASDALVLASRNSETWGLVVNEALHHGLVVVVSDKVGCAPDLVSSKIYGEVFQVDDVNSLAHAMKVVMHSPRDVSARTQRQVHVSTYSIDNAAVGIMRAYNECISDSPRSHD